MRYLLDTNIFIYAAIDRDQLSRDVKAILDDYDNTFYMSSESVKELIVGFNNGKLVSRFWDTAAKMVKDITNRMPLVSSDRKFKFYEDQGLELVFNEK